MKKYNTLLVVSITILVLVLLTWIFPVTYLNGELVEAERSQAGIVNLLSYPVFTFYNFIYVFLYLISIGGLYGILGKIGAYRLILERVSKHIKGRELLCLILTVLIIAIVVSFTGFTFEMLLILPFIAGVILLLGYDNLTAGMITVGSIGVGVIGTTFSKLVAGTFNDILGTKYLDLVIVKAILLIFCAAILIYNIIRHAKNVEKTKTVSESFFVPAKVKEKSCKVWPLATMLIIFVLVLVMSTIDWDGAFNITIFSSFTESIKTTKVLSKYIVLACACLVVLYNLAYSFIQRKKSAKKDEKLMSKRRLIVTIIFGVIAFLALLKIMLEDVFNATDFMSKALELIKVNTLIEEFTFGKLLGNVTAFGEWSYNNYLAVIILLAIVLKFVYHVTFEDMINNTGEGMKKVLYACFVCMLAYTVLMLTSSHPVILTILKPILNLTDGLSILSYPFCTLISALFNTDFTYYQYGVLPLTYATSYFTSATVYPLCELITQAMYGLAIIFAPTSVTMLFSLSILDIKYTTWLKKMWLPLLELLIVVFIAFIVVLQFFV